jgi:hypothetical protein
LLAAQSNTDGGEWRMSRKFRISSFGDKDYRKRYCTLRVWGSKPGE